GKERPSSSARCASASNGSSSLVTNSRDVPRIKRCSSVSPKSIVLPLTISPLFHTGAWPLSLTIVRSTIWTGRYDAVKGRGDEERRAGNAGWQPTDRPGPRIRHAALYREGLRGRQRAGSRGRVRDPAVFSLSSLPGKAAHPVRDLHADADRLQRRGDARADRRPAAGRGNCGRRPPARHLR